MENKYTLSVLFVNYEDFWSKVVYYLIGGGYSHAAIGIDQDQDKDTYYSFTFKGFRREMPKKHKDIVSKSVCYELNVSKEEYEKVVENIEEFQAKRFQWKYNLMGMFLSIFYINRKKKNHYFCSEFVAETLEKAKILKLYRETATYLPSRLEQELQKLGTVNRVVLNPI